jgi:hypothetical protein
MCNGDIRFRYIASCVPSVCYTLADAIWSWVSFYVQTIRNQLIKILQLKIDYTACVYSMPITNEDRWVVDFCKKNYDLNIKNTLLLKHKFN